MGSRYGYLRTREMEYADAMEAPKENSMTTYERICREECEWCAKGVCRENGVHYGNGGFGAGVVSYGPCTAPPKGEVIERLAKEVESCKAVLALAGTVREIQDAALKVAAPAHPDSVRLDWLEKDQASLVLDPRTWKYEIRWRVGQGSAHGDGSARSAIDAAIMAAASIAHVSPEDLSVEAKDGIRKNG